MKINTLRYYMLLFFSLLMSSPMLVSASQYEPWEKGDYGVYQDVPFENTTKATVDKTFGSVKHFTQFAGFPGVWTLSVGEKVYTYDEKTFQLSLLTDFNAAVGFQSDVALQPCNVGPVVIGAKGLTVKVPAGTFSNVVRLDFKPSCTDGGVLQVWFAAGVGFIKWTESSIIGLHTYELIEGLIAGNSYPKEQGIILKGTFPDPVVWINQMPPIPDPAPIPSIDVSMSISNKTLSNLTYEFLTSQRFDIVLQDEKGRVVKKWSDDKIFLDVIGTIILEPGQSYSTGGALSLSNPDGTPIAPGNYTLSITLSSTGREGTSHAPGVAGPTLSTPLQIKWAF